MARLVTERRLVFHGDRRLAVEALARPALAPGEVRVAPAAVGICGSDIHGYAGINDRRAPGVVMGHEVAGRVVELGPAVTGLDLGTPVALNPVVAAVVVSEPEPHRRAVLAALGLRAVPPHAVQAAGHDAALECVGLDATVAAALAGVRPGGRVVMVGVATPQVAVPVAPLVMEERALLGSAVYSRADFAATVAWIAAGEVDLAPVIERRVALEELPGAFAAYAAGAERAAKTMMTPG